MKNKTNPKLSTITISILIMLLMTSMSLPLPKAAAQSSEKTLMFEDSFEGKIADFWNQIHGTPKLSSNVAHSGSQSYLVDAEQGGLVYNFGSTVSGETWEFEAWFYDNMSTTVRTFGLAVGGSSILGVVIWSGGNFNSFYGYRDGGLGSEKVSTVPRSLGWHKITIQCTPANAKLLIDDVQIFQTSSQFSFNRFFFGDWWIDGLISNVYYDDIKVWKYQTGEQTTPTPTPQPQEVETITPSPSPPEKTYAITIDGYPMDWIALGLKPLATSPPNSAIGVASGISKPCVDLLQVWFYNDEDYLYFMIQVQGGYPSNWARYRYGINIDTDNNAKTGDNYGFDITVGIAWYYYLDIGIGVPRGFYSVWVPITHYWGTERYIDMQAGELGFIEWRIPKDQINLPSETINLEFFSYDDVLKYSRSYKR